MKSLLLAQLRLLARIERADAGEHHARPAILLREARADFQDLWRTRLEIAWSLATMPVLLPPRSASCASSALIVHRTTKSTKALAALEKLVGKAIPFCSLEGRSRPNLAAMLLASRGLGSRTGALRTLARAVRIVERFGRGRSQWLRERAVLLLRQGLLAETALRQHSPAFLVCESDLSASRMALATAANHASVPVVYVQQFYKIPKPNFAIDAAFILNDHGFEQVRSHLKPEALVAFYRLEDGPHRFEIARLATGNEPQRIGVCLNNFADPESLPDVVRALARRFPKAIISVRPHPNERRELALKGARATVATPDELLENFCCACDLLVCASTSVIIEGLSYGRPVVHVPGLDIYPFDSLGYVAAGVVFGLRGGAADLACLNLAAVDEFYGDSGWPLKLAAVLGGQSHRESVDASEPLTAWLRKRLSIGEGYGSAKGVDLRHRWIAE